MKNQQAFCTVRKFSFTALLILCCSILLLLPGRLSAQDTQPEFDEIIVTLKGDHIGTVEIPAIIIGQQVYLPVSDLFNFLTIKNSMSASGYAISGHVMNPSDVYSINRIDNQIVYKDSITKLNKNDIIFSGNEFYLNVQYLGTVFGLQCAFSFRSLTIDFSSKIELPFMREKRLEQMRRNITKVKGEIKADTIIKKSFKWFNLGAIDWSVVSGQYKNKNTGVARLGLGAIIAGGETNVQLTLSDNAPFNIENQYFLWRYVNNDKKLFKQIAAGRVIAPGTFSSIPSLLGVQINNTATRQRRGFGTYTASDFTQPGWIVELYVNEVLVDYTKADASGLFSFQVPLVYGNTNVKYKFYGPWGEEVSKEQMINIPFAFLPKNTLDYSLTAGTYADSTRNPFSRLNINYGVSKWFTVGAGSEYNGGLYGNKVLPFINGSMRLANAIIVSGEYAHNTFLKSAANIRLKNKLQLEASIVKFVPGQEAIRTTSLQDRKLTASMPFTIKNVHGFTRLLYNHSKLFKGELKTAELLVSAVKGRFNTNLTTYAVMFEKPEIMTRVSCNFLLPFNIRFTPMVQYRYNQKDIVIIKAEAEKRAFKNMVATVAAEHNKLLGASVFSIGVRKSFSFMQAGFSARQVGKDLSVVQAASGGLLLDSKNKKITALDRGSVGRGTIIVIPFLDYNCNGIRDKNEPDVLNLNLRVDGCKIDRSHNKAAIKISALEAYNKYYLQVDDKNFDNPAYKIKHKTIEVTAEPNHSKTIEIAVSVVGEAAGFVYVNGADGKKGLGRLIVLIYNEQNKIVGKTMTEPDGYFSYLGLPPGKYTAYTDDAQLNKIGMKNNGQRISFVIKENKEGDIVDDLELQIDPVK